MNRQDLTSDEPSSPERTGGRPPSMANLLSEFLRWKDVPCPVCGYNLRNLTRNRCPECGQRFALRVGAVEPRFGHLLMFVAPMIMTVGVFLLCAMISIVEGPPPTSAWGIYLIMATGLVEAVAVPVLYRLRRVFLRRTGRTQALLCGLSWAGHILLFWVCLEYGT